MKLLQTVAALTLFSLVSIGAHAQSIQISPGGGSFNVGDTVEVEVVIGTPSSQLTFTTVQAYIKFSSNILIKNGIAGVVYNADIWDVPGPKKIVGNVLQTAAASSTGGCTSDSCSVMKFTIEFTSGGDASLEIVQADTFGLDPNDDELGFSDIGDASFSVSGTSSPPNLSAISPNNGPTSGGTSVTLTGTNLTGATAVSFGGTAATNVTAVSATSVTCTSPARSAGAVQVTVTTPNGTSNGQTFTYNAPAAPTLTAISPNNGPTSGGTSVTLTGTNLTGATAVSFGGTAASNVTVVSATSVTCTSPAKSAGAVQVTVTTPNGTSNGQAFTYTPPCTVTLSADQNVTSAAGTAQFTVTSSGAWSIADNQNWASVDPPSGTGNGTVTVTYGANTGTARSATLTVTRTDCTGGTDTAVLSQAAPVPCTVTLSADQSVSSAAGTAQFTVTSSGAWSIADNQNWASVEPASGTGNGTVTVTYGSNTGAARSATLTVTRTDCTGGSDTAVLSQAAPVPCTVTLSADQSVSSAAGTAQFTVTSAGAWSIADNQNWASVEPASGTGNGTVTVTYGSNTGAARSATLTVTRTDCTGGSDTAVLNQAAPVPCQVTLSADQSVSSAAGTAQFTVTSAGAWSIADNQNWASVEPASGTGNGTVTVTYGANSGASERSVTLNVTRTDCTGGSDTALLRQGPRPAQRTLNITTSTTGCVGRVSVNGQSSSLPFTGSFPEGAEVSLEALNFAGAEFSAWGGVAASCGTTRTCSVTMTGDRSITLAFDCSAPRPENDDFEDRIALTGFPVSTVGTNIGATHQSGEDALSGQVNPDGASVWWSWRAPSTRKVLVSLAGSSFDTILGVYTGTSLTGLTLVAANDDAGDDLVKSQIWPDEKQVDFTSRVSFEVAANVTYQIRVDGYPYDEGTDRGSIALRIEEASDCSPSLVLTPPSTVFLECGDTFEEPGYAAVDCEDGTVPVLVDGLPDSSDSSDLGSYTVTYTATDTDGNTVSGTRTVLVLDSAAPVLTLDGDALIRLDLFDSFIDPGYAVSDTCDSDPDVLVEGFVDTSSAGTYTISYVASDDAGNTAQVTRTVEVSDAPDCFTLTVNGGTAQTAQNCTGGYKNGTVVTIVANTPPSGQVFDRWTGDAVANATSSTTTITMNGNKTVTATYRNISEARYFITIVADPSEGTVSLSPPQPSNGYLEGTQVELTATAADGYFLFSWGGALGFDTSNPIFITLEADVSVEPLFYRCGDLISTQVGLSISANGGYTNFQFSQSLGHCPWSIDDYYDWVYPSARSGIAGPESSEIAFYVDENPDSFSRQAIFTVDNGSSFITYSIQQDGQSGSGGCACFGGAKSLDNVLKYYLGDVAILLSAMAAMILMSRFTRI